jgi:hypothetical protein
MSKIPNIDTNETNEANSDKIITTNTNECLNNLDGVFDLSDNNWVEPELTIRENMTQQQIDKINSINAQRLSEFSLLEELMGTSSTTKSTVLPKPATVVKQKVTTIKEPAKEPTKPSTKPSTNPSTKQPAKQTVATNSKQVKQKNVSNRSYDEEHDLDEDDYDDYDDKYDEYYKY